MKPPRSRANFAAEITAVARAHAGDSGRPAYQRRSCKRRHEIKRPALYRRAYTRYVRVVCYSRSRLQHATRANQETYIRSCSQDGRVCTHVCTRAHHTARRGIPIVHTTYLCSHVVRMYRLSDEPVYTALSLSLSHSHYVRHRAIGHRWHSITYNARIPRTNTRLSIRIDVRV